MCGVCDNKQNARGSSRHVCATKKNDNGKQFAMSKKIARGNSMQLLYTGQAPVQAFLTILFTRNLIEILEIGEK